MEGGNFPIERFERVHTIGDGSFGPPVHILSSPFYKPSKVAVKHCSTNEEGLKLSHCNIIQYFGKCELEGRRCLVMEACNGDLNQLMNHGSLDRSNVSFLTSQCLSGLSHLHGLGVVHGDLKPSNILLKWRSTIKIPKVKDMAVKITDFGCSSGPGGRFVMSSCEVQQKSYLAPELRRVYEEVSKIGSDKFSSQCSWRTDVYCLGMIVREMVQKIGSTEGAANNLDKDRPLQDFLTACQKENPQERKKAEELLEMEFVVEHKETNEIRQREYKAVKIREFLSWKAHLRNSEDKGKVKAETVKEIPLRIFLDLQRLSRNNKPFQPTILHVRSPKELAGKSLKDKFGIEDHDSNSGIYMFMLMPHRVEQEAVSSLNSLESSTNYSSRSKPLFPIYFSSSRNFGAGLNKQPVVKQYFAVKTEGERDGLFHFFDSEMVHNYDLLLMVVAMPVEITSLISVWMKEDFDFVLNGSRDDKFTSSDSPYHVMRWPKSGVNSLSLVREWSELDKIKYEIYVQRLMGAFGYAMVPDEEEVEGDDIIERAGGGSAKRKRGSAPVKQFMKMEGESQNSYQTDCNFHSSFV